MEKTKGDSKQTPETKATTKLEKGMLLYLNPVKSMVFVDELSGVKLGYFDGWNSVVELPEIAEDKQEVLKKAIEKEVLLTSAPKGDNRIREILVVEDETVYGEAIRKLNNHFRVIRDEIKSITSRDLILSMISRERVTQKREDVLEALNERLEKMSGEKTVITGAPVEKEFEISNLVDKK